MNSNETLLTKHAKSFNWAGYFLPKSTFDKCSILYDFCRTLDDIADNDEELETKKQKFLNFKTEFNNENSSNPIILNFNQLLISEKISRIVVNDLFDGIESDIKKEVDYKDQQSLTLYCYRVAGTVGLMMAKILKVQQPHDLRSAIELGIAMQLTNIARDVVEDKKRNRIYIEQNFENIVNTIKKAEVFYNNSFTSIKSIPLSFRFAILVARRVYKKIGDKILLKKNIDTYNNAGKIYVNNFEKTIETFNALFDFIELFFLKNENELKKKLIIEEIININERI